MRRAFHISLRRYVLQDTAQDFAKLLGLSAPLGNGVRHGRHLRSEHEREVVKGSRG